MHAIDGDLFKIRRRKKYQLLKIEIIIIIIIIFPNTLRIASRYIEVLGTQSLTRALYILSDHSLSLLLLLLKCRSTARWWVFDLKSSGDAKIKCDSAERDVDM